MEKRLEGAVFRLATGGRGLLHPPPLSEVCADCRLDIGGRAVEQLSELSVHGGMLSM